jgi:hypothetical protein
VKLKKEGSDYEPQGPSLHHNDGMLVPVARPSPDLGPIPTKYFTLRNYRGIVKGQNSLREWHNQHGTTEAVRSPC